MKEKPKQHVPDDTVRFLGKIVVLSAVLSCLIKYGGALLPFTTPFTESLNSLVTVVVLLPSLSIGAVLLRKMRRS
ncbi:MAG: hypothetical protein AAF703_02575 [Cyanobacteria bacterium P01_D01_bin.105]